MALVWRDAGKPGAVLEVSFPVEKKGRYSLTARLGKYRTFGTHQFLVNGKPVGKPVDFFGSPAADAMVPFSADLGTANLKEGENLLALRLVGTNPDTIMANHGACIDWIQLGYRGESAPAATAENPDVAPEKALVYEADNLRVLRCTSGEVRPAKLAEEGSAETGAFTGDRSLQWHGAVGPGAVLTLALPVEKKGRYAVPVRVARYRAYAIHQFLLNGKPLGKRVDMFGNPGHDIVTPFTVDL